MSRIYKHLPLIPLHGDESGVYSNLVLATGSTRHFEAEMKRPGLPHLIHYCRIHLVGTAYYQMRASHTAADLAGFVDPDAAADPRSYFL